MRSGQGRGVVESVQSAAIPLRGDDDALIHIDVTRALEPLEAEPAWRSAEVPETYPSGM